MASLIESACWMVLKDRFLGVRTEEELKLWLDLEKVNHPSLTALYSFDLQTKAGWEEVIAYVLKKPSKVPLIDMYEGTVYVGGWEVLDVEVEVLDGGFEIKKLTWLDPHVGRRKLYDVIEYLDSCGEIEQIGDHCTLSCVVWHLYHGGVYGK